MNRTAGCGQLPGVGAHPFEAVFDEHFDAIFGYFARRVPRSDAADLAAETFRLALGAWPRFDAEQGSPRPWLYGFAGNVLRHHQRSRGREAAALRRLAALPSDGQGADLPADDAIDAARRWPAIAAAVEALAPIDREALLLLAWEDLTYAEIAQATGVPIGTVRSRLNRARSQLRELIDGGGQQGADTRNRVPEEATDHG
ncbi:MAG TPA: RNA polymerase sigma factor [Acidimicrobiales bacterium]